PGSRAGGRFGTPREELGLLGPRAEEPGPPNSRPSGPPSGPIEGSRDDPRDHQKPSGGGPRGGPKPEQPPTTVLATDAPSSPLGGGHRRWPPVDLPLTLGSLTVHSLGAGPVATWPPPGFHSSRLFASTRRPTRRCLYSCRVLEGPRCQLLCQDEPGRPLAAATPDLCHRRLLQALAQAGGRPKAPAPGAGDHFFGLSHPTVRRLLRGEAPGDEEDEDEEEE
ncbi:TBRG1 regulator, partial [Rhinopomastus cyanomelas]|nr:TBRG1 regulator [Rhinopomastus cyanomelas]